MRRSYKILIAGASSLVLSVSLLFVIFRFLYNQYYSLNDIHQTAIIVPIALLGIAGFVSLIVGGIVFFLDKRKPTPKKPVKVNITFTKFALVACTASFVFTIGYVIYVVLKHLGFDPLVAGIIGFLIPGTLASIEYLRAGGTLNKILENTNFYYKYKQYDRAVELDKQLFNKDPKNYALMRRIGYGYAMLNENENALKYFEDVLKINQIDDPELLLYIGTLYHEKGDYENAIKFADESLKIKKDYDVALYNKAASKAMQKNSADAISLLREVIRQNPARFKRLLSIDPNFKYIKDDDEFRKLIW